MLLRKYLISNFYKYKRKTFCWDASQTERRRAGPTAAKDKPRPLKVLFFGTDNFSLPSLEALHRRSTELNRSGSLLGAVTSFKSPANCVRLHAEKHFLPLYKWPVTPEICQEYDLGVVVSFGHLIPAKLINKFPLGMINVHASLLPRWRGAAPIIYAIMHGDRHTGVSIMKIEPKHFDVGDILAQQTVPIGEHTLMPELYAELAEKGASLLIKVLDEFPRSFQESEWIPQKSADATFAPKITASLTEVKWFDQSAEQLYQLYRALYGFKQLSTLFRGKTLQLVELKLPATVTSGLATPGNFIYERERKCLIICCAGGSQLEVHKLRLESKKLITAMDFKNGYLRGLNSSEFLLETKN